jgi:hypothetical protein
MFVCCQVEVFATSWLLVQRSPTDCGASFCVITKPRERGHSPRWAAEPEKIIISQTARLSGEKATEHKMCFNLLYYFVWNMYIGLLCKVSTLIVRF